MSRVIHFLLSFSIIIILSLLISSNPKNIRIRFIVQTLMVEIILGYIILHSPSGLITIQKICTLFQTLSIFAAEGTNFVFGQTSRVTQQQETTNFFCTILCPIIFMSAIIGVLKHTRILEFFIRIIGTILSKINGMGKLESFNAISSLILGQSENFIIYKDIIQNISAPRMYTMAITAMSTVSLSITGVYITMLNPTYVIAALVLNMFSTFIIVSLINPYVIKPDQDLNILSIFTNDKQNIFEIIGEYILIGFKIAVTVAAMLIGFIAIISACNAIFENLFHISLQKLLGYIFYPLIWVMGIPKCEILQISSIIATKLISNEFIAIIYLNKISNTLSPNTIAAISVFLVSFANFSSIGIIIGSIKGINTMQGNLISGYSFKLIYSSTLINILSAIITQLII
ncbi:NupC/NupG family nucleoside CNT transporter [Candidatus Blochmannia ocreatus (nom. nud.)]|uniref:NupC/NupG family nucleoside CNT transporter n=1 Tax=Candidatus Blochmannia ocreatus (nom. nud.) TaxID=251538 RepID=A0ABY4SSN5_9ENTR|nr:nucleoside transporter C-terminal domain-containing protein [Candidatus Blochmannia ocreatus]URJ24989.1 NupC/NupG family nucleoside CNT transporter [Candidatus Blochmannia ocreatus]